MASDIQTAEWPMFGQNAAHTNYLDVQLTPANFKFDWRIKLGDADQPMSAFATPLVVTKDGIYTIVTKNTNMMERDTILKKISIINGKNIWSKKFSFEDVEEQAGQPSVYDDKIYFEVGGGIHQSNGIYIVSTKSGDILNQIQTTSDLNQFYLSPTFYKDSIYANENVTGGIYSINKETNSVNWFTPIQDSFRCMSTPAVNDNFVVYFSNDNLNVIERSSGALLKEIKDPNINNSYLTGLRATPILTNNNTAIFANNGYLTSFDLQNNNVNWTIGKSSDNLGDGYSAQCAVDSDSIYIRNSGYLDVLDKNTGKVIWQWKSNNVYVGESIIATKNLIFFSADRTYAIK